MVDERIYITDDGYEFYLAERLVFGGVPFLLLYKKDEDNLFVAYESDGKLVFIDDDYPQYSTIFQMLFEKYKG